MELVLFCLVYYVILGGITIAVDQRNKRVNSKEAIEARYQDRRELVCICGDKLVFGDKTTIHPDCQFHRLRGYHETLD